MKVTFILPGIGISGGVRVVVRYAIELSKIGYDVKVVYPEVPSDLVWPWIEPYNLKKKIYRCLFYILKIFGITIFRNNIDWIKEKNLLYRVPSLSEKYIPDADVVLATQWGTAYYVNQYSKSKGRKFYLIQHYETWCGEKKKVEQSYKFAEMKNIVISNWLKRKLEAIGAKVDAIIPNGIDLEQFFVEHKVKTSTDVVRIGMIVRKESWKGSEQGLRVLKKIKQKYGEKVDIVLFGEKIEALKQNTFEFSLWPTGDDLRTLYNSCEIFLFPSCKEGFGLPPFEAIACGCAVVTTKVGAVVEYLDDGVSAMLVDVDDSIDMENKLKLLIDDSDLRRVLSDKGKVLVKSLKWENAAKKMVGIIS